MTTIDTLRSLQQRIREATGPDRELDCIIQAVMDGRTVREDGNNILARNIRPPHDECLLGTIDPGRRQRNFTEAWRNPPVPNFTTDPDGLGACVALIDTALPRCHWSRDEDGFFWVHVHVGEPQEHRVGGKCLYSRCLMLLDAIFSAKIAELEQEKEKADV